MHQLNTKNIEIHEWEHECIHSKSNNPHSWNNLLKSEDDIQRLVEHKKRQFNQTYEIPEISS